MVIKDESEIRSMYDQCLSHANLKEVKGITPPRNVDQIVEVHLRAFLIFNFFVLWGLVMAQTVLWQEPSC
jgi:hypothetical protein